MADGANNYGGCEGPDAPYLKLISEDGYEFIIKREYAKDTTIEEMYIGKKNKLMKAEYLRKLCHYLICKAHDPEAALEVEYMEGVTMGMVLSTVAFDN